MKWKNYRVKSLSLLRSKLSRGQTLLSVLVLLFAGIYLLASRQVVQAVSSSNYTIPQYSLPSFGQTPSSTHYKLLGASSPAVGVASSASYALDAGFPSETGGVIAISVDSSSVDLGSLSPGSPITGSTTVTITTDATGYSLAIEKNKLMTLAGASATIADISASIASPSPWSGTGFGFSVSSATALEAKWSSGANFASIPTQTATTFHTLAQTINSPDTTTIDYKLDTATSQTVGDYASTIAITATILP